MYRYADDYATSRHFHCRETTANKRPPNGEEHDLTPSWDYNGELRLRTEILILPQWD